MKQTTIKLVQDLVPGDRVYWLNRFALVLSNETKVFKNGVRVHVLIEGIIMEWTPFNNTKFDVIS